MIKSRHGHLHEMQLVGGILVLLSCPSFVLGRVLLGTGLTAVGLGIVIVARFLAWRSLDRRVAALLEKHEL